MKLKLELYERLKRLPPTFFDDLRVQLNIPPPGYFHPDNVPYVSRVMELIEFLETSPGGLGHLKKLLDDFSFHHNFLPPGAFPVGAELFQFEEAKESEAMAAAEERGEDPENYRVTPEKFYTFRPEAEWLGIFRKWDSPRSFHKNLIDTVLSAPKRGRKCPAAAIIGPGGSGKSVSLRRLAVDLAEQGQKVWWIEERERFLMFGWSQLEIMGDIPNFLLLDNIQHLERDFVQQLQRKLQKSPSLILVIAGRSVPTALGARIGQGSGLFEPEEAKDLCKILQKIADTIPEWAVIAHQLMVEPLQRARLIRILVVLARQKAAPQDLQELETTFLEILADDIQRISVMLPGLADAVIDAIAFQELGINISRKTLIALADHYQPKEAIPIQLEEYERNQRWRVIDSLMSFNRDYDSMSFHHDELAEGLLIAGQRGLLGSRVIGDDYWRKATLELVIQIGCRYSSSNFLGKLVLNRFETIGKDLALKYIRKLLEAGNSHHAYLRLIIHDILTLEPHERLELLLKAIEVAPFNDWFWGRVWVWIQRCFPEKEKKKQILENLFQAGCRAHSIINPLLKSLSLSEAQKEARQMLKDKNTHREVLCRCLALLGEDAKGEAKKLLEDENTHPYVLCRCLTLLGEEAKDEARKLLEDKKTHPHVLCSCLDLIEEEEAKGEARKLLEDKNTHPDVLCRCLTLLGEEAKGVAKKLLYERHEKEIICSCLALLGEDEEAKGVAKKLLYERHEKEIICSCLTLLGEEAKVKAKLLLENKETHPYVLSRCVEILGLDAKDFALERIRHWRETDSSLLMNCLKIAGRAPEAAQMAEELLLAWQKLPAQLRVAAIRVHSDNPLRIQFAKEILNNWQRQFRPLVAAALSAHCNNPEEVTENCKAIITIWHREIFFQNKRRQWRYDGHLIKALSHPALRKESQEAAHNMLLAEAKSPGFLTVELLNVAENIIQEQWQPWSETEET